MDPFPVRSRDLGPPKSQIPRRNHDKPGHAKLSRRISERLDGRTSVKISDNYEIDENDFKANESGKSFGFLDAFLSKRNLCS